MPAVQTFGIYAIHTEQADVAAVDRVTERVDHAPVLIIVKSPFAGRKDENLGAGVSKDQQLHISAKRCG